MPYISYIDNGSKTVQNIVQFEIEKDISSLNILFHMAIILQTSQLELITVRQVWHYFTRGRIGCQLTGD